MGGEKIINSAFRTASHKSPPHGRGKDSGTVHGCGQLRITPAWAGKSSALAFSSSASRDHPRVGGEKWQKGEIKICTKGSPPRGRGKEPSSSRKRVLARITPAWAGKRTGLG